MRFSSTMKGAIIGAILVLSALVLPASQASQQLPEQRSVESCHGKVDAFNKFNGWVKLRYRIVCSSTMDKINTRAFIREGDRKTATIKAGGTGKTCFDDFQCQITVKMKDRPGKQRYIAGCHPGSWWTFCQVDDDRGNQVCHLGPNGDDDGGFMPCEWRSREF